MSDARTVVVTGSASGLGAATTARLEAAGQRVIGVDLHDAEVVADLGTAEGRESAIAGITEAAGGSIDGLVTWAGLAGLTDRPGDVVASVNYFGTVELLEGLRPLLARGDAPAAVAIASNATTVFPNVPMAVVEACLAGDEDGARAAANEVGSLATYPASKLALSWWCRRHAPTDEWAGAGITLNVVAPGAVETPILDQTRDDPVIGQFLADFRLPIGRNGTADELAAFVEFLLGPNGRFFCGSVLFCDGGSDALVRADDFPSPWS
jgi:NAD(P)-dependent dehydrogenase (short-subunit alcohol dehydrogenase family)